MCALWKTDIHQYHLIKLNDIGYSIEMDWSYRHCWLIQWQPWSYLTWEAATVSLLFLEAAASPLWFNDRLGIFTQPTQKPYKTWIMINAPHVYECSVFTKNGWCRGCPARPIETQANQPMEINFLCQQKKTIPTELQPGRKVRRLLLAYS